MNEDVNRFSFFRSYYEILEDFDDPQVGYDFVMKILRYVFDGVDPDFKGIYHALWRSIKPNLDSSVSHIRRGAKGGRPNKNPPAAKADTNRKADEKLTETKQKATEKLTESYGKATEKLTESYEKANGKQAESKPKPDKDKEEDKEKDKEEELGKGSKGKTTPPKDTPVKKEKITASDMIMSAGLSPDLTKALTEWVRYKSEKRQGYKETGLKALITQVRNNAEHYGDPAMIDIISQSMAAGWQGICFDKLTKQGGGERDAYTRQPAMEVYRQYAPQPERYNYRSDI